MKIKLIAIAAAATAVLMSGCWQKSVHAFYTEKDVLFIPELVGTWTNPKKEGEEAESWTFTKSDAGDNVYKVVVKDGKTNLELDGRAFKLGGSRWLDLHSRGRSITEIPAHHLLRIKSLGDSLQVEMLSLEWVHDYVGAHPKEIAHVRSHDVEHPKDRDKDEFILTATTEELQKFVLAHMKDEKFFVESDELKKGR